MSGEEINQLIAEGDYTHVFVDANLLKGIDLDAPVNVKWFVFTAEGKYYRLG
jgi:hypothetical protein